jgi:hypothetical protein
MPSGLEDEICALISAAGPLAVGDIAGGLDAPVPKVAGHVEWMLRRGTLRPDEFGRLRLWGDCATAA